MKTPKVSRYRQHQSFRWIENSKFSKLQSRKSVFLEKMWKKTLARHNITYHLSSTVILKKVSKDLRKSLLSLIRGARGVRWRSPRTPNCYDAQRCHWNFGTQTWQISYFSHQFWIFKSEKNVSKCRSRLTLHLEKNIAWVGLSLVFLQPTQPTNSHPPRSKLPCWHLYHAVENFTL